jgi:RimJ/RimL family protein N-acetyltransferase
MTNNAPGLTNPIQLRPTVPADLAFVVAAENAPENKPYIFQWPAEKHLAALANPDVAHLVVETAGPDPRLVGYAIVNGLENRHRSQELMRFVITEKGQGFGKAALEEIKRLAFEEWRAHRLWLDVIDHNLRAQGLYTAVGFQREGVLREAYLLEDQPLTVVIMSILAQEYFGKA